MKTSRSLGATALLVLHMKAEHLPRPEFEYRFDPNRRWRADIVFTAERILIEVDGGIWTRGRHVRADGFAKDLEKLNRATELGWAVYRYTPEMIESGEAIRQLKRVVTSRESAS